LNQRDGKGGLDEEGIVFRPTEVESRHESREMGATEKEEQIKWKYKRK
jgi:hypothetical protein